MQDFLNEEGTLSVILGKGYISLYEVNNLKKGDVFQVPGRAGESCFVCLNNEFLCNAEVVVIEDQYGIRISRDSSVHSIGSLPGVVDDVIELLPMMIKLDEVQVSINELSGITPDSIIAFDKKYSRKQSVELITAGIPIAKGLFMVINENFGIEITDIYHKGRSKVPVRSSGYKVDTDSSDYKINYYNFARPDKFTWETILKFKSIHNLFIENCRLLIPEMKNYKVLNVDQLTFCEFFDDLGKDYNLISVKSEIRPGIKDIFSKSNRSLIDTKHLFTPAFQD